MSLVFESETCGRCGGTGKHSFNQIDGDRCYGCSGRGTRLTKRGNAAQNFYVNSQNKPWQEVNVGEYLNYDGKWRKILEITNDNLNGGVWLHTKNLRVGVRENRLVRVCASDAQKAEQIEAALKYQATLTKTGKPSKKSIKAAA